MRLQFARTTPKKRRSEYVDREKMFFEAWDNLDTGKWSVKQFLNEVSHFEGEIDGIYILLLKAITNPIKTNFIIVYKIMFTDDIVDLLDAPLVIVLSENDEISPEVLRYASDTTFLRYETQVIQLQDEEDI